MIERALYEVLDEYLHQLSPSILKHARENLSDKYRKGGLSTYIDSDQERISYLATRMPATFAALRKVFSIICETGSFSIKSMLDLGSGPGTGLWAASEFFSELNTAILIEKDRAWEIIGKQLLQKGKPQSGFHISWCLENMSELEIFPSADLVILSYSIGELPQMVVERTIEKGFHSARELFVVIEPGTPLGFKRIVSVREQILAQGGYLVAPCTHALKCPISENDWCHFSTRLNRSNIHRKVKDVSLGYEDEKFSFIAFSKKPQMTSGSRIVRHPEVHSGHIQLTLCSEGKIEKKVFSRKLKDVYQVIKKATWGDTIV